MRKWIATLLMLALVAIPAWAEGESGILYIENIFLYETAVEGDQNPEKSLAANAAYRAKLASLVVKLDDVYETETLSFHTKQALAVENRGRRICLPVILHSACGNQKRLQQRRIEKRPSRIRPIAVILYGTPEGI